MARQRGEKEQKKIICVRTNQIKMYVDPSLPSSKKALYVLYEIAVTQSAKRKFLPAAARIKTEVGKDDPSAAAPMLLCFP